jgi:hypothetical protein
MATCFGSTAWPPSGTVQPKHVAVIYNKKFSIDGNLHLKSSFTLISPCCNNDVFKNNLNDFLSPISSYLLDALRIIIIIIIKHSNLKPIWMQSVLPTPNNECHPQFINGFTLILVDRQWVSNGHPPSVTAFRFRGGHSCHCLRMCPHPPTACISPLYRKFGNSLVNVFPRTIVQHRVAGQSLETGVASSRLAARGWCASTVVGKGCVSG